MATHDLKTLSRYYEAVCDGSKTFEVRFNDRNYQVGDKLILREWEVDGGYSGWAAIVTVTYVLSGYHAIQPGFVVLGIRLNERSELH